jgi:hypothetical protein
VLEPVIRGDVDLVVEQFGTGVVEPPRDIALRRTEELNVPAVLDDEAAIPDLHPAAYHLQGEAASPIERPPLDAAVMEVGATDLVGLTGEELQCLRQARTHRVLVRPVTSATRLYPIVGEPSAVPLPREPLHHHDAYPHSAIAGGRRSRALELHTDCGARDRELPRIEERELEAGGGGTRAGRQRTNTSSGSQSGAAS